MAAFHEPRFAWTTSPGCESSVLVTQPSAVVGVDSVPGAVGVDSVPGAVGVDSVPGAVGVDSVPGAVGVDSVPGAVGVDSVPGASASELASETPSLGVSLTGSS